MKIKIIYSTFKLLKSQIKSSFEFGYIRSEIRTLPSDIKQIILLYL